LMAACCLPVIAIIIFAGLGLQGRP